MEQTPEITEYECPVCTLKQQLANILGAMGKLTKEEQEIISGWAEPLAERLVKPLAERAKEKGQMRQDLNFYADIREGNVIETGRTALIPIGGRVQHYQVCLDVCPKCGEYYAVKVMTQEGIKSLPPPDMGQLGKGVT